MTFIPANNKTHIEQAQHDGKMFFQNLVLELDSTDTYYVQIKTPATGEIHMYWNIDYTTEFESEFYEAATEQTDGSLGTTLNANRNSSTTSNLTMRVGVSAPASTGTTVDKVKGGTDGGKFTGSTGGSSTGEGVLLKNDTVYIRKFLSNADGNIINAKPYWIEE